jgi:hypothetical protein
VMHQNRGGGDRKQVRPTSAPRQMAAASTRRCKLYRSDSRNEIPRETCVMFDRIPFPQALAWWRLRRRGITVCFAIFRRCVASRLVYVADGAATRSHPVQPSCRANRQ